MWAKHTFHIHNVLPPTFQREMTHVSMGTPGGPHVGSHMNELQMLLILMGFPIREAFFGSWRTSAEIIWNLFLIQKKKFSNSALVLTIQCAFSHLQIS